MDPVRNFVITHFGVTAEDEIKVWGPNPKHTWQTATDHHITATFKFNRPIDASIMDGELQAQACLLGNCTEIEGNLNPHNLNVACAGIYGIKGVRASSSYPFYTIYRTSYMHPTHVHAMKEQDRLQIAGGGIRGAVFHVNPHTESKDCDAPFLGIRYYHYQHPEFVRSFANVLPENLMNGIFYIPREICVQCDQSILPVYKPEDPTLVECEELQNKLLFWYFVPTDHVMAWPFHAPAEYRRQQEWNILEYRVRNRQTGAVEVIGFLVCNRTMNRAKTDFLRTFAGKVHLTDLRNLDIQMVPAMKMITKGEKQRPPTEGIYEGLAQVRVKVAYYLYETMTAEQVKSLCPTLSPDFPKYSNWIITK